MKVLIDNPQILYVISDVRKATRRSTPTINRWIADGKFPQPKSKILNQRYWLKSDIDVWLTDHGLKGDSGMNNIRSIPLLKVNLTMMEIEQ